MDQGPHSSSLRHYSLMDSLLNVLNSSRHDETECVLARYFLDHFDDLPGLNVYDVADACFTSRSGIRRFCQSIGLDNFSDLKSYAWEWERHRSVFVRYASGEGFRENLSLSISAMTASINELVGEELLDELARLIRAASQVVVLTSDFSAMAVRQFQQSMLYLHKIVHIVTDSCGDPSRLGVLGPEDMLVVVSEHGGYARAVQSALRNSSVPRALITVDCDESIARTFDLVLRLSHETGHVARTVYTQYGVLYLLDLLYNRYCLLCGEGPGDAE